MTIQPKFHWKFQDKSGATTTVDSISKVQARLSDARPSGHGRSFGLTSTLSVQNSSTSKCLNALGHLLSGLKKIAISQLFLALKIASRPVY